MLNCRRRNKGFSLLELIIAIAILAIGIVVILEAMSFSVRAAGVSCDITNAAFLAEDKIQELEFKERQNLISLLPDNLAGQEGNKFKWHYLLAPQEALSSDKLVLYKLDFNLTWQGQLKERVLNLNTYLKYERI